MRMQQAAVSWSWRWDIFLLVFHIKDQVSGGKVDGQASNPNKSPDVLLFYSFPRNILFPSCSFRKEAGCAWTIGLVLCCLLWTLWLSVGQAWEPTCGASKDQTNSEPGVLSVIAWIKSLGMFALEKFPMQGGSRGGGGVLSAEALFLELCHWLGT